jgi:hypothetical protein
MNVSEDFLKAQIVSRNERIQQLEEHVQKVTQRDYNTAGTLVAMRDNMHEWTMSELESEDITEQQANAIAEICGFELLKEVEVEVTVTYTMTVNLGPNDDVESIVTDEINFDAIEYDTDKISWMNATVDRIDF